MNQVKREYNGLGQLTSDWQEHAGAVTGSSLRVQYAYSEMAGGANHSRLTSMTYPNGKVLTYNYAAGLPSTVSRLSSLSDTSGTLEGYDYLGLGTVVRRTHPQPGVDLTYVKQAGESDGAAGDQYTGLDRFGRVVDQRWLKTSGGTHTDRFQYGYDRDSNPTYRDNAVNAAFGEVYAYDGLNQMTSFQRGTLNATKDGVTGTASRSQGWDYDALGNWDAVTTDGSTQTRTHNRQNEVGSVGGATTPTYDANGNLTKDQAGQQYVYDAWNRLVAVKDAAGATIAQYKYDGLSRRASETRAGATTDLYYSAAWQVLEERAGGAAKAQYVWSPVYVDALVLRDRDADGNGSLEERLWAQQDANFNVTALADGSGNVVERYAYDPFGGVTVLDATWGVRTGGSSYGWVCRYQGLRQDPATGLHHARYRDLHPALGRPLQRDPLGFAAGDANVYRWVGNGPAGATDPLGLYPRVAPEAMAGDGAGQQVGTGGGTSGLHWTDFTGIGTIVNLLYNGGDYLYEEFVRANRIDDQLQEVTDRNTAQRDILADIGNPNYPLHGSNGNTTEGSARNAGPDPSFNARRQTGARNATGLATTSVVFTVTAVGLISWNGSIVYATAHGGRHLAGTGLTTAQVEAAIGAQIQTIRVGTATGSFWGRVVVNGQVIEYRAYTLANGTINVGTYYPVVP